MLFGIHKHNMKIGATLIERATGKVVTVSQCTKCPKQVIKRGEPIPIDEIPKAN
jgi:hypothetical protein